jgi:ABC-type branched-subunit amino acid transport system permease subunit/ABC-type branched-subunit amino acid transport system ATPase component
LVGDTAVDFLRFLLLGLGAGCVYALVGQGLVAIYRGSGVLNFAQGAVALVGAAAFAELRHSASVPVAAGLAVVLCGLLGAATHLLLMRPLRNAAPIIRVIATLGLLVLLQQAIALRYQNETPEVLPFLPTGSWTVGDLPIVQDRAVIVAVAVALCFVLTFVYRRTGIGRATAAVAENELVAQSLGYRPDVVAAVNWAGGSMLAGLAGILLLPIEGLDPATMPLIVIPALAAAMIGGFSSFWLTLGGGLLIGVAEAEITRFAPYQGWSSSFPFLIVVVVLVLRGRALPLRGHRGDRLPAVGNGLLRPVPIAAGLALSVLSVLTLGPGWTNSVITSAGYAIVGLSLVVLIGYAGQLSLAQFALAGIGALAAGRAADAWAVPFPLAVLLGVVAAMLVGLVVALPALRVRGVNLAVVTLALAVAISNLVLLNSDYTGGPIRGTVVPPPSLFGVSLDSTVHPVRYAVLLLAVFTAAALAVANLRRGAAGRRMLAVRANERAAAALGISTIGVKLFAFAVGAALAGLGGALIVFRYPHVNFSTFDVFTSINLVLWTLIGGIGYVLGPAVGSLLAPSGVVNTVLDRFIELAGYVLVIGSILVIATLLFSPDGQLHRRPRRAPRPGEEAPTGRVARRYHRRRPAAPPVPAAAPEPAPEPARERVPPVALRTEGLAVRFGSTIALDGVSLLIRPGEVVGLIGPNGAGKTTFIDAVCGNARPAAGRIWLGDRDLARTAVHRRARAGLGRSFQSLELFEDMTVEDNIRTACDSSSRRLYLRDLVWPRRVPLPAVAVDAIGQFGLADSLHRRPGELPHGRRRLVAIARAVAAAPSVLLLDEPAAGLDDAESAELGRLVRGLADDWGMAVILVEHHVPLVAAVCDRTVVLDAGRPIAAGTSAEVLTDERVVSAFLGAVREPGDRTEPRPTESGAERPGAPAQRPVEAAGEAR